MTPRDAELERARALLAQARWAEAVPHLQAALQAQPADVRSGLELSACLQHLGLLDEAVVIARTALGHARAMDAGPASAAEHAAAAQLQLAHLYAAQRRHDDAGAAYSLLLSHPTHRRAAAIGVAQVWLHEGYPSRALQALEALADDPAVAPVVALAQFEAGAVEAACATLGRHLQRLSAAGLPPDPPSVSNALMWASYLREHATWTRRVEQLAERLYAPAALREPTEGPAPAAGRGAPAGAASGAATGAAPGAASPSRPLRVGFVSADFCAHPVGYFVASFLPHLAAHGVETLLYSNGRRDDHLTDRLRRSAARFVSIATLDTAQAVQAVRADAPDILIDLAGHTHGHRLDVFAARAAPRQASYLGYFASTRVAAMDWVITDAWHVPPGEETSYTERVARLPVCRFCYLPPDDAPDPAAPPRAANGYTTFGACANVAKLGDEGIELWSRVLVADPASRLVLRWKTLVDAAVGDGIRARFARHGIAPGRVELHGALRHREMLAASAQVDVVLDTWPFSGATTTCEALWMGLPVLTLPSDRPVGRQTQSILLALGRAEWIARDADDYVRVAVDTGRDLDALQRWRGSARAALRASTLTDGAAYAAHFAALLRAL